MRSYSAIQKAKAAAKKPSGPAAAKRNVKTKDSKAELVERPKVNLRRRQQRSIETRARILEAAGTQFAELGFLGTTTRGIADIAGVDYGLITHHFESKEALWSMVFEAASAGLADHCREVLASSVDTTPEERLASLQDAVIRYAAKHPVFTGIMSHARMSPGPQANIMVAEHIRWLHREMADLIEAAQRRGRFVQGDPKHLVLVLFSAATRLFATTMDVELLLHTSTSSKQFIDRHIALCRSLFFRPS